MGEKFHYDDDDMLAHVPLTPEDIDWLLDKKHRRVLHKKALEHFLTRCLATARELRNVKQSFDIELQRRIDLHSRSSAAASNLSPLAAARYLSAEQLSALFDAFSQQRLEILEGQRQAAQREAQQARMARRIALDSATAAFAAVRAGDTDTAEQLLADSIAELSSIEDISDPDHTATGLETT